MKCVVNLLFLLPSVIFAQFDLTAVIVNINREPLPLTNVVLLNRNVGIITNEKGEFSLSRILKEDSIKLTNIAYHWKIVAIKDLENNDSIFLNENSKLLDEVLLKNLSYKNEINLGFNDYPANGEFKLKPGNQIAVYIANRQNKEGLIKGVFFKVKDLGKCKNSMRVRIIQHDTLKFGPFIDILDENVIIRTNDLKKSNYVDLSSYKIILPKEGIFVVLEWLKTENGCMNDSYTTISANLSLPDNIVWFNFMDKAWSKNFRPRSPNGNYMSPNLSLKVAYN